MEQKQANKLASTVVRKEQSSTKKVAKHVLHAGMELADKHFVKPTFSKYTIGERIAHL